MKININFIKIIMLLIISSNLSYSIKPQLESWFLSFENKNSNSIILDSYHYQDLTVKKFKKGEDKREYQQVRATIQDEDQILIRNISDLNLFIGSLTLKGYLELNSGSEDRIRNKLDFLKDIDSYHFVIAIVKKRTEKEQTHVFTLEIGIFSSGDYIKVDESQEFFIKFLKMTKPEMKTGSPMEHYIGLFNKGVRSFSKSMGSSLTTYYLGNILTRNYIFFFARDYYENNSQAPWISTFENEILAVIEKNLVALSKRLRIERKEEKEKKKQERVNSLSQFKSGITLGGGSAVRTQLKPIIEPLMLKLEPKVKKIQPKIAFYQINQEEARELEELEKKSGNSSDNSDKNLEHSLKLLGKNLKDI